jgi:hypothetical protein
VVAKGLAREPEGAEVGVIDELGDGAEQVAGEGAGQRRERSLQPPPM